MKMRCYITGIGRVHLLTESMKEWRLQKPRKMRLRNVLLSDEKMFTVNGSYNGNDYRHFLVKEQKKTTAG